VNRGCLRALVATVVATLASTTIVASTASAAPARLVIRGFGADQGWTFDKHVRVMADITGDGAADIVGFGDAGVATAIANGGGVFFPARFVVDNFGYNQGWRVNVHNRFVTDITGDGAADIVGLGNAGTYTAVSTRDGGFGPVTFQPGLFAANECRLAIAADINGDTRTDLICVQDHNIRIAKARGDGGFTAPVVATREFPHVAEQVMFVNFADLNATRDRNAELMVTEYGGNPAAWKAWVALPNGDGTYQQSRNAGIPSTGGTELYLSDINGDRFPDFTVFGDVTYVELGRGDGTFNPLQFAINGFGTNAGWIGGIHWRQIVDLNRDGRGDVVGFGDEGITTALGTPQGTFAPAQIAFDDFGYHDGWIGNQLNRFVVDITGDGIPDVVGFGPAGVYAAVGRGDGTFA